MNKLQDDAKAFLAFWNAMLKYGSEAVTNNLPYLEAMAQGKTVERRIKEAGYDGAWYVKDYADGWDFSGAVEYRIKPGPEPTYRAYTRDECVEHCLGKVVVNNDWNSVMVVTAITDKMGNPVTDLRAEELTVLVDGKKAPVTNVMFFGKGPATTAAITWSPTTRQALFLRKAPSASTATGSGLGRRCRCRAIGFWFWFMRWALGWPG